MTATSEKTASVMPYPQRFREGEERGRRLGRALKPIAGVGHLDEKLMDRIGRDYFERDDLGDQLCLLYTSPSPRDRG